MTIARGGRCILGVLLLIVLGGCVAGQKLRFDYAAEQASERKSGPVVGADVKDKRPFVVDGNKKPSYLGHFRATFGNTWDVHTDDNEALAAIMTRDLTAELQALGFKAAGSSKARRTVSVAIVDWNFDAYTNTTFWYECAVSVLDETGNALLTTTLKEKFEIEGSALTGPKAGVEREMPKIYRSLIRKMVRENPSVLQALDK